MTLPTHLHCPYSSACPGCDWIHRTPDDQIQQKKQDFLDLMGSEYSSSLEYQSFGTHGLRDRLDFVMEQGRRGLFQKPGPGVLDLEACLQLSKPLQDFYSEFRKIEFPQLKGSFRLRVGPRGERGVWLDFANSDIKTLLDSKSTLQALQKIAHVEIGQKHKTLIIKPDGTLGLGDPQFKPWFQSSYKNQSLDLFSTIGSFTQPGHISNAWITKTLSGWFETLKPQQVLEFGSGIGNLTLPALSVDQTRLISLELDPRSAAAQDFSLTRHGLRNRVDLRVGDFRMRALSDLPRTDVFLVNPARNGVGQLFESSFEILGDQLPKHVIYMSCFPETFALDTQSLKNHGYVAKKLILVDQFPQTHHVEILSHWELE